MVTDILEYRSLKLRYPQHATAERIIYAPRQHGQKLQSPIPAVSGAVGEKSAVGKGTRSISPPTLIVRAAGEPPRISRALMPGCTASPRLKIHKQDRSVGA
jgi:hypothetical protein